MQTEQMPWPRLLLSAGAKVLKQISHSRRQRACCDAACFCSQVYSDAEDTRRRSAEFLRDILARVLAISVTAVCGPVDAAIKSLSGPLLKVPKMAQTEHIWPTTQMTPARQPMVNETSRNSAFLPATLKTTISTNGVIQFALAGCTWDGTVGFVSAD
jgi:hypothetical protein